MRGGLDLRRKESSFASQDGNEDFVVRGDFVHCARELVVVLSRERIEFLGDVEGYDGDFAAVFDGDGIGGGHDDSLYSTALLYRA